jgi:hypothetical protein
MKTFMGLFLITLCSAFSVDALGQSTTDKLTILNKWVDISCEAVYVDSTTVYFGSDGLFEIIDFDDPANPVEIGRLAIPDTITALTVQDSLAYLGTRSGLLLIVDISDKNSLRLAGTFEQPIFTKNPIFGVGAQGRYVHLFIRARVYDAWGDLVDGGGFEGLWTIDAFDLSHIVESQAHYSRGARNFIFERPYIYLLQHSSIRVFDAFLNPAEPVVADGFGRTPRALAIEDDRAFFFSDSLIVLDVSDVYNLRKIGASKIHPPFPSLLSDLRVRNKRGYLLQARDFRIFDFSEPDSMQQLMQYQLDGRTTRDIAVSDDRAYIAHFEHGLSVWDVSDPGNITKIGNFHRNLHFNSVVVDGNLVYVGFNTAGIAGNSAGGLWVMDWWSGNGPQLISSYEAVEQEAGMALRGNLLFVADQEKGLHILDTTDPSSLQEVSFLPLVGPLENLVLHENYIYLTKFGQGVQIIDITDVQRPVEAGLVPGNTLYRLALGNTHLYVLSAEAGLEIYDITSPTQPIKVGQYIEANVTPVDMDVQENYAYLAAKDDGLIILDVMEPSNPVMVGQSMLPNESLSQVRVSGNFAYVGAGRKMMVIDVSSKQAPSVVSSYDPDDFIRNLAVYEDTVYVSQTQSLYVLKNDTTTVGIAQREIQPRDFHLHQNYPNPFNAGTTILLEIPSNAGPVEVAVYNLTGQLVTRLYEGTAPAGNLKLRWDGRDEDGHSMASGVYIYAVRFGDGLAFQRKLILLR